MLCGILPKHLSSKRLEFSLPEEKHIPISSNILLPITSFGGEPTCLLNIYRAFPQGAFSAECLQDDSKENMHII